VRDAELDEALRAFLHAPHHPVKIIITTRVSARELDTFEPARQRLLPLDTGLQPEYAREAFVLMDEGNLVGIKNAGADLLNLAVTRTLGLPRALEALYAALRTDRFTTLQELLDLPILPEQVVQAYVGEAFNRLDTNAQKVMQALAVYNRPVTPAAVDYLLAPHLPAIDSAPILQRLANMHFARKESGRFYLHPVDREFAFGLIPEKDLTTKGTKDTKEEQRKLLQSAFSKRQFSFPNYHLLFTRHDLTLRAADFFAAARKPRAEWKKLDDLSAQLAEFDLRCAAGDYDTAASVLGEIDGDYLFLWGHYHLIIQMRESIAGKITDTLLRMDNFNMLGAADYSIGRVKDATNFWKQGISAAQDAKNRRAESTFLGNLGSVHSEMGDAHKAIEFYEQALVIAREIGNRNGEGLWLYGIGNLHQDSGNVSKAIEYYEQAVNILHNIGNRKDEGYVLGNLGGAYAGLGDIGKAIEYHKKALIIAREIGDRSGEATDLGGIAACYEKSGEIAKAIEYRANALSIVQEIGDKKEVGVCLSVLGSCYKDLDNQKQAKECFEQSLAIAQETGYRYGEGFRLLNLAGVEIEFKNYERAIELILQSTKIGNEISRPHLQNNGYVDLALVYLLSDNLVDAQKSIEAALQYDVPENNHNASALHGIIVLRQGEEVAARGAFVRAIGQADEILSKTAEYYSALDAKGIALSGLVVSGEWEVDSERRKALDEAVEIFKKARKIAPHAGVVKSVLRLFDELAKCDAEGILKDVRKAAEGVE
jgi:tetratricopeptide (TPR) repeat protein